jgi:hypothetical protein
MSYSPNMKKKFTEGPKARENFERVMTSLFQAPKTITGRKKKTKKGKS